MSDLADNDVADNQPGPMPHAPSAPLPPARGLGRRVIAGVLITAGSQGMVAAMRAIVLLILAKFLNPEEMGLAAFAMIGINVLTPFWDAGLGAAIIQKQRLRSRDLDTVFWTNMAVSTVGSAFVAAGGFWAADWLHRPGLGPVLAVLAAGMAVTGFTGVPYALLRRELQFASIARRDFISECAYTATSIPLAAFGWGVWSLVGGIVAQRFTRAALAWSGVVWRPRFRFCWRSFRQLTSFGIFDALTLLSYHALANGDALLVGLFLGDAAIGVYTLAVQLAILPIQRMSGVILTVMFPAFAQIQSAPERLRTATLSLMRLTSLISAGFSLVVVFAAPLLGVIYGDKWQAAIDPLQMLAVGAMFQAVDSLQAIFLARGRPGWRLLLVAVRFVGFVLAYLALGRLYEMTGVGLSVTFGAALAAFVALLMFRRLQVATVGESLQQFAPALVGLFVGNSVAMVLYYLLVDRAPDLVAWPAISASAVLVYSYWMRRDLLVLWGRVRDTIRRRAATSEPSAT